jgi:serine phosphatase RsbU (regulator of sigma subunit)
MDVALCKINAKTREVNFAGAHRPFIYNQYETGKIQEIKGDKFPIGGGSAYSNKQAFADHHIQLAKNDSFYLFSDGYPDQFNPENKKYSQRQMLELIQLHYKKSLSEVKSEFDQSFLTWMSDTKQTDDVLLIGIRL